jgi:hypothetical protein
VTLPADSNSNIPSAQFLLNNVEMIIKRSDAKINQSNNRWPLSNQVFWDERLGKPML